MMTSLSMPGLPELFMVLLLFVPGIVVLILDIVALVDLMKSKFRENDKLIWALVVLFLPFLGALLYFIIGGKQRIKDE